MGMYSHLDINKLDFVKKMNIKKKPVKKFKVLKTKIKEVSNYKCRICGKEFTTHSARKTHHRKHYAKAASQNLVPVFRQGTGEKKFLKFKNRYGDF